MVKGISRQVILVQSPDQKLFDQAIFILKDGQKGLSDEALLREARQIVGSHREGRKMTVAAYVLIGMLVGAALMGVAWVLAALYL